MAITRLGPNQDITAAKIAGQINFKNLIINGDMSIAQRGTSVTGITGGGYYTVDRMNVFLGSMGTWTHAQSTTVPTGQGFANSLKIDCTTADASPASGDYHIFGQKIEGQMLQMLKKGTSNAESVTISFWVRSNKTGTYTFEMQDVDNSRQISKTYTIDSADTWEKKTITIEGDTSGGFGNDNTNDCQINWWLGAGSAWSSGTLNTSWGTTTQANRVSSSQVNLADSTSNEWLITGMQMEVGTSASDFEFLPYDVNLFRCQRYFTVINNNGRNGDAFFCGFTASSTAISGVGYSLATTLRIGNPTITKNSSVPMQRCTVDGFQTLSAGAGTIGLTAEAKDSYTLCINLGGYSGMTSARPAVVSFPAATNAVTIDAEL